VARVELEDIVEAEFLGDEVAGYPTGGFLDWAFEKMGVTDPDRVLHLFSGGLKRGITVDLRPSTNPTVCCDAAHTPFEDASFDWIMADSPITDLLNTVLYGLPNSLPDEGELRSEVRRLLRPGGCYGFFNPIVPVDMEGLVREKTYAVVTGPGRIVAGWHLMRRV
jgi:hypothetical protein